MLSLVLDGDYLSFHHICYELFVSSRFDVEMACSNFGSVVDTSEPHGIFSDKALEWSAGHVEDASMRNLQWTCEAAMMPTSITIVLCTKYNSRFPEELHWSSFIGLSCIVTQSKTLLLIGNASACMLVFSSWGHNWIRMWWNMNRVDLLKLELNAEWKGYGRYWIMVALYTPSIKLFILLSADGTYLDHLLH